MQYTQAIDYLFKKLPIYQRKGAVAYKKDIGNIVAACNHLKNPENKFKSIHVAGTNGKGSTSHIIASIMQEAGYKTGLYTSPHLKDFRERIRINGEKINKNSVLKFIKTHKLFFEIMNMSFFEYTVAMAFDFFAKENIDIAIIETGLGGRLDSTNIINPEISIITNISVDHIDLLGNNIQDIAIEKAGIIKKGKPVVIGRKDDTTKSIFIKKAKATNSSLYFAEDTKWNSVYKHKLSAKYQKENIRTAITAINVLGWNIKDEEIRRGIQNIYTNTKLRGRWEILSKHPLIICDTGHNQEGIKKVCNELKHIKYDTLHFVFGTVKHKNIDTILALLPKHATYYFCKPNVPRGYSATALQRKAKKNNLKGGLYTSVKKALLHANSNAKKNDLIFIGGSTFVVAEII